MRHLLLFAITFPLLGAFISTLAHPLPQGHVDSLDLGLRADLLEIGVRALDVLDLEAREYPELFLEARAPPKRKVTAGRQAQRKENVRTAAKIGQDKKMNLRASTQLPHAPVRQAPRRPKPNMKPGDPKTPKGRATQQAANQKLKDKKAAGRAHFADAKAAQKATTNLPNRRHDFIANGQKYSGADVRRAVFNGHLQGSQPGSKYPKVFENRLQGPKNNKSKPLPNMTGSGREFPVSKERGGYRDGRPLGPVRVITQGTGNGGHKFQGVVAHDSSIKQGARGRDDHITVRPMTYPKLNAAPNIPIKRTK